MIKTVAVIIVGVLLLPLPARGHTQVQQDEWLAEWTEATWLDGTVTPEEMQIFLDFTQRHPVPPPTTVRVSPASTSGPKGTPTTWSGSVEQWRSLVEEHFNPSDVPWAMRVMSCESGGNPNATNDRSGAAGLFQHLPKYWAERSAKAGWGGADIYDPEANIAVAAWLFYKGGPSHWVCK